MDWKYLFTSRDGRINRKPFWLASLVLMVVSLLVVLILMPFLGMVAFILLLPVWFAGLMVMVKRAHDRDRPEWYVYGYAVLSFVLSVGTLFFLDPANPEAAMSSNGIAMFVLNIVSMIWGLILFVDLGFLRGTRGPNRYGPDPLG
jgi:uncharacterized membrane protein YhaH (DUF805 family)